MDSYITDIESYITDMELIEGLLASSVWALFFYYFKKYMNMSIIKEGALAWLGVWFVRKLGLSLYLSLKKKYNLPSFKIMLFPYPELRSDNKSPEFRDNIGTRLIIQIAFWILLILCIDTFFFKNK